MIKSSPPKTPKARRTLRARLPGRWLLQDAKARFSELVRRVRSEGPQRVTIHGREEVVVISAEEFRRLNATDKSFREMTKAERASCGVHFSVCRKCKRFIDRAVPDDPNKPLDDIIVEGLERYYLEAEGSLKATAEGFSGPLDRLCVSGLRKVDRAAV